MKTSECSDCIHRYVDCPIDPVQPVFGCTSHWPKSRNTTQGELITMHINAEQKGPLEDEIRAECEKLADFLCAKNRAYGNSAGQPIGIFARRADPLLAIDVRIDDKLNRLAKGGEYQGDDTVQDLIGYLILRRIVNEKQKVEGCK